MKKCIFLICMLLSFIPFPTYAAGWTDLNGLLDETLQFVKQKEYEKAQKLLEYFAEQFKDYNKEDKLASPEDIRAISVAFDKAFTAIQNEDMSENEKWEDILALRLVIDAEQAKLQPLWMDREQAVMKPFDRMETAMKQENDEEFQYELNLFLNELSIIYPSLTIDLPHEELHRLNAHVSYLEEFRNLISQSPQAQGQVEVMKEDLQRIFSNPTDKYQPSLMWVMNTTATIILITLTYVGWRKYKGDREKKRIPSK
ncbi:sporulation protein YpjB [Bacillus sp. 165]|uniref:sporulation protein YpjB n=1 Tax=Bacillus sp. 165 TaxID=1529117 RepID=UPI001ADC622F|nr:sporulation protein YpjB [Bacillus sp. 165]MBO9128229.1 sporulation protein YpjB [Bacillus sp. 165]